jgi:hypothetical protein
MKNLDSDLLISFLLFVFTLVVLVDFSRVPTGISCIFKFEFSIKIHNLDRK